MQHTCKPRSGIKGLYAVELEPHSPLGRRIWTLGPYKSSWNNGCDACLIWKVAQRCEHIVERVAGVEMKWTDIGGAANLRQKSSDHGKDWMNVTFGETSKQLMMTQEGMGGDPYDAVKAVMGVANAGQTYRISRITSSPLWRVPRREARYEIIKLPIEDYTEAKEVLKEAGFGNGFARASLSISQIEWQLRESFDPGIDLN